MKNKRRKIAHTPDPLRVTSPDCDGLQWTAKCASWESQCAIRAAKWNGDRQMGRGGYPESVDGRTELKKKKKNK